MILLNVQEVTRQFDAAPVLDRVTFEVRDGDKIGLVGPNGAGKSTLLNTLAGIDDPDVGSVELHPSARVALLEQEAQFADEGTLWDETKQGLAHLYELQTQAEELSHQIAAESDPVQLQRLHKLYDAVQHDLHRWNAYNVDHRVEFVLEGLGFREEDFQRRLPTFSGGQRNRVLLARILLQAPDVMLLDEPTNHLDIATTEWLEAYLGRSKQAMIIVSHDRYFLDRITNRTLELVNGSITDFRGNFSAYWQQRDERNKVLERTFEKQQEFIAKTEDFIQRNKYGQKHAQATDRVKKLERLERVSRPREISLNPMSFGEPSRTGDWVIDAVDVAKGFGTPLFENFSHRIERGDRIGIFGSNGSGKTTLIRVLIGDLPPDCGLVRFGAGVKIAYFDQQLAQLDPERDAIENVRPADDPSIAPAALRSLLARFGMTGDIVFQKVGSMSGGEKSRVALASLSASNANVLVLDEPTNHLDVWARASLETALKQFDGTLLFVSHDRYFLDRTAASVIVLEPTHWKCYAGNYSDFLRFQEQQRRDGVAAALRERDVGGNSALAQSPAGAKTPSQNDQLRRKRKFPYRKVADLEKDVAEKEVLLDELHTALADPAIHRDPRRLQQVVQNFESMKAQLDTLYEHWEEALELN